MGASRLVSLSRREARLGQAVVVTNLSHEPVAAGWLRRWGTAVLEVEREDGSVVSVRPIQHHVWARA